MVSRENRIIAACIVVAVALYFPLAGYGIGPDWFPYAVLVVVGLFVPGYLTGRYRA